MAGNITYEFDLSVVKLTSSLSGKRILVTGADGFIGSHLTSILLGKGADVKALAWYRPQLDVGCLSFLSPTHHLEVVRGDILDTEQCRKMVEGVDLVFHLAALIGIPYSYQAPRSYLQTNIEGTLNLLEAAKDQKAKFLFMSTSEVYGTALSVPISEDHPLQPQSPYSASKIGAEALVRSYFHSFDMEVYIARVFNTYGPRQSTRAILPTIITQLAAGAKKLELGDLSPTRDLVYVDDTCLSLIDLIHCEAAVGLPVNISTGVEISMENLVSQVQQLMKTDVPVVLDPQRQRPAGSEVLRLCGDPGRLDSLGLHVPSISLSEGLSETISWFRDQNHHNFTKYHV